jgi:hypothetical protein
VDIKQNLKTCCRLILSSRSQYVCNSIKAIDFSTLYTTITHTLLKSRIKELIQRCFSKKNGDQRYLYLVVGRDKYCFVKSHSKAKNKYKQDELIQMLDFFIDNIFGERVFQQTIGIPMGTNCAPLIADLFLHAYDADFLQGLSKIKIRPDR